MNIIKNLFNNKQKQRKYSRKKVLKLINKLLDNSNNYPKNIKIKVTSEEIEIINHIFASAYLKVIYPIKIRSDNNPIDWSKNSNTKSEYTFIETPYNIHDVNILSVNAIGLTDKGFDYINKCRTFFKNYISVITAFISLALSIVSLILK